MKPKISVIIPVYNDPEGLRVTLESLVAQDFPRTEFEIIVVDNGSTDHTREIAATYAAAYPDLVIAVEENEIQSSYAARNKEIRVSRGQVLCFVDANMSVEQDYLAKVDRLFASGCVDYVGFSVKMVFKIRSIAALYDCMTGFNIQHDIEHVGFAPTCCLAIRREIVEKVGMFDSRLVSGGDLEFGRRVKEAGFSLRYVPDICMMHPARSTLGSLIAKHIRIGRGFRQLKLYYPDRFRHYGTIGWMLQHLLPSIPWRFWREYKTSPIWTSASPITKISLYGVRWIVKLARLYGYLIEWRGELKRVGPSKQQGYQGCAQRTPDVGIGSSSL